MSKKSNTINILTIDGGGIRGIIPAEILVYVEKRLKELYGKDTRLSDHFDYIAGTSTGGILAALYVIPNEKGESKYTAQDSVDLYVEHGSKIFKRQFRWYSTFAGLLAPRYNADNIEDLFEDYFGTTTISEAIVPFMVASVDTYNRDLYLFKSYNIKNPYKNRLFKEAVRATSAAPTYFKPINIKHGDGTEYSLVDGGLAMNNPTASAFIEVMKLFPNAKKFNTLSLGTGGTKDSYPYKVSKKWGVITGASKLFNISLKSGADVVNYQMLKFYESSRIKGEFLRIDPSVYDAKDNIDLSTEKNLQLLVEAGKLSVEEYKDQIDEFLKNTI